MISHDFKLIFIHIPKCAGRSICESFNQRFDHYTANYYRSEFGHFWSEYEAFTIVRNPYARYVSMFHYIQEHRRHSLEPISARKPYAMQPTFQTWLKLNTQSFNKSFYINSPEAERGTDYMLGSPFWFSPQVSMIQDSRRSYNDLKVFKMEDGFTDLQEWMKKRKVTNFKMPHLNKSSHDTWQTYYDDPVTRMIATKFKSTQIDCDALDYELIL